MAFSPSNDRIAGFCQAVLYKSRVTTESGGSDVITDHEVLTGVQAVGVSRSLDREVYVDIGRMQNEFGSYNKHTYTINVSRVIGRNRDFFYNTNGETTYEASHILSTQTEKTIGTDGIQDRLKNYDITLVYGKDSLSYIGKEIGESPQDPENLKCQTTTYRCCLLTSISYTIPISGPVTEDLTFTTSAYTQDDVTNLSDFSNLNFEHTADTCLTRRHIDTINSILPYEVQKAFDLGDVLSDGDKDIPIYGLQQIEISVEINYNDLVDIGKWGGSSGNRAEQNIYRQVEIPVGVSCTFSGVVRAQYMVDIAKDHEVTDTYYSAGTYGSEAKNDQTGEQYRSDREIKILAEGDGSPVNYFQWHLGDKNYITSFEITGGDADGGNVEASMSFQNDHSEIFLLKDTTIQNFTTSTTY